MAVARRLLRGQDGVVRLVFVDTKTGQQFLNPPPGQEIIDAEGQGYLDLSDLGLDPVKKPDRPTDNKSTAEKIKDNVRDSDSTSTGHEGGSGFGRSGTNNFGYVNTPGIMGLIGLAPGMVGMVGKGINAGINANNVAAINEARGVIGLEALGPADMGKGFLGIDKGLEHGKVADISLGKNTYSVGLEALDEAGRTTLTPEEASKRAAVLGVDIDETSREDDEGKGLFSQAASFISGLFGPDESASKGYPDAPSRTSTDDNSVDMAGGFGSGYGSGYGVGGVGTSQAAGYGQAAASMGAAGISGVGGGQSNSNGSGGYGEGGVGTSQSAGYGQAAESMGQAGMSGVGDTSSSGGNQSGNSDSDSDSDE